MSYNKLVVVFSPILLLALATGKAWANNPIVPGVRVPLGHPAPIIPDNGAASGSMRFYGAWVASSGTTGSFDAMLPQKNAIATQDAQIASAEISVLSQNPAACSTRTASLAWSAPGGASPPRAIENSTNSAHVHTGIFPGAKERVASKLPMDPVQTGVFWSPQGFYGKAQGFSLGSVPKSGFDGGPDGPSVGSGTWERHGVQGHRLRKRGTGNRIWPRRGR